MNKNNNINNQASGAKMGKGIILRVAMIVLALATVVLAILFIAKSDDQTAEGIILNVTIEAGDEISPSMFLYGNNGAATFVSDVDCNLLSRTPGTHPLKIKVDGQIYTVNLVVKDTVPPKGKVIPMIFKAGTSPDAAAMVKDIVDVTDVKVSFQNMPDMTAVGKQNVAVKLVDAGGNEQVLQSTVFICEDLKTPVWEIGLEYPKVSDFTSSLDNVIYENQADFSNVKVPGEYLVALGVSVGDISSVFYAPFKAVDTIAPVLTPKENYIYDINTPMPQPHELIASYVEYTEIRFEYLEEYSISEPGVYTLKVKATDIAGNITTVNITVNALDTTVDNSAPIITVNSEISIKVGQTFDISGYVTIFDDKDGNISLNDSGKVTVDASNVNNMLPGSYHILVTAVDSTGKVANATVTVKVSHAQVSNDDAVAAADKFLEGLNLGGMSRKLQIKTVFENIYAMADKFTASSDKTNPVYREAYYGLTHGYGDSYTVACMVELLLSRLDVDSRMVNRIGGKEEHYWNFVDFSDGWYHFDASFHDTDWVVDGVVKQTYKLTDGELALYTEWYNGIVSGSDYYRFNTAAYPATPVISDGKYIYTPYKVMYLVSEGGSIRGESLQEISHGMYSLTVMAIPASGYKFVGWSDGVTEAERRDVIKSDFSVTAIFEKSSDGITKTYILTYNAQEGGTINGITRQSVKSGYYGSEVVAVANSGYKFAGWSDGVSTAARTDISKSNMTVIAYFVVDDGSNFTLEYAASLGGSISGNALQIVAPNEKGSAVTAVPSVGYKFNCWSDGVTTATRTDVATGDIYVTASFVPESAVLYTVKYTAGEGGSILGIASQRVVDGSTTTAVTAVASRGYVFIGWSDGVNTTIRTDVITEDITLTANFMKLTAIDVVYLTNGAGGYIQGMSNQQIYSGESTQEVVAVANEGYKFVGWSDGVLTPDRTDMFNQNTEVTAIFEELVKFTFTYTAGEGGSVTGELTQTVYIDGVGSAVVAVPNEGYKFVCWSDGVLTAERMDTATADITVEAVFEPLAKYTVSYVAGSGGTVSGVLTQTQYEGMMFSAVVAVPDEGYAFVGWSDGLTEAERNDIAAEDIVYTAEFAPVMICTIYYTATPGGSIEGEIMQTLYIDSRGSEVTAVASEGYVFDKWSDGVTTATRSDIATSSLMTITAIFVSVASLDAGE